jgi:hypothetical protein
MNEQELRALVRDVVARRLGQAVPGSGFRIPADTAHGRDLGPSHAVYLSLVNVGGECVIEPGVTCNHCNYCKSHGH